MSTHKHFDKICGVVILVTLVLTIFLMNAEALGIVKNENIMGYENKLFDTSKVHSLNIIMDDWNEFLNQAQSEENFDCTVIIDGEIYKNVAIRGKGNTSLSQVSAYGNDRYSFKIEFDHYEDGITYHGLDKLCLNNVIQDNTYMKDHLTYRMMNEMGVAAPLSTYAYITVNGEDWGLYLAVEGVEDSFLTRNYGSDYGELYKPDSVKMGGGRGNGKGFDMDEFMKDSDSKDMEMPDFEGGMPNFGEGKPNFGEGMPNFGEGMPDFGERMPDFGEGMPFGMGNDDVLLKYIDNNTESYSNFFDSYTGAMIHNYYLYENDGQMQMIPWDYNLAYGGFQASDSATNMINYPIDSRVSGGNAADRPEEINRGESFKKRERNAGN